MSGAASSVCTCPVPAGLRCPAHPEAPSGPEAAEALKVVRLAALDALDAAATSPSAYPVLLRERVGDEQVAALEVAIRGLERAR